MMDIWDKFMSIMAGLKCEDENTLSDTIWAMCMADKDFLQLFFAFMFDKKGGEENAQTIIREVSAGAYGRNDFIIITDKGKYYVENKINDKNLNLDKYLKNNDIDDNNLAYIINHEELYRDFIKEGNKFEITVKGKKHEIPFRKWIDFAKKINKESDKYKYISYYIDRITNNIIRAKEKGDYERIYNSFINSVNKVKFIRYCKDDTWDKYKAFGNNYIETKDHNKLWFYIKYTPEFGYMFIFGIDNKFQDQIYSQGKFCNFKECNPLGYYFHDYYSVYYVDVRNEIKEKDDDVIEKLGKALEEMKKYVGIESISCSQ